MNLSQSLGAAAAALVMGLSAGGPAQVQALSDAAAEARRAPAAIRGAVEELAALLEVNHLFPDVARHYAGHLRARAGAGEHDGANGPQQLAAQLNGDLNAIHRDAHLRATLSDGPEASRTSPAPSGDEAFGDAQWLAGGVAYLRINELPGDEASIQRLNALPGQYACAGALCREALSVEFDVPVEVVHPAVVQVMRRETSADVLQLVHSRPARTPERAHTGMVCVLAALAQITWRASGDDVLPSRPSAFRARHDVIESEIVWAAAILASEAIAQEHVEARERRRAILMHVVAERDHARQLHFH